MGGSDYDFGEVQFNLVKGDYISRRRNSLNEVY